ncbi:hypothetical protein K7X08_031817 [Anisodus acutangulus]|uniref:OVATE domain-containing protein n=1 Tax=Anisodus acutangulus TaxID=402998 RepID=A0A9Q1MLU1_9SOLA|nr:hypothetical protein K7X08_031817 [Anisodus acutangulus]
MLQRQRNRISFSANLPEDVRGAFADSICAVKYSMDPLADISESIREMVKNVGVQDWKEMEELVYCYIVLNSEETVDPKLASYGVENPLFAVIQLAQTTMGSELGNITLDKTFEERDTLNDKIVMDINAAAKDWGLKCLHHEIRDISPPPGVRAAMEMQAEAERKKKAQVLESEGEKQANINIADGRKSSVILASEAAKMDQVNRAQATAKGIALVSQTLKEHGDAEMRSLNLCPILFPWNLENDICLIEFINFQSAFSFIAFSLLGFGTTLLLPTSASDPASTVAQALDIYKNLSSKNAGSQSNSSAVINNDRFITADSTDEDYKKDD